MRSPNGTSAVSQYDVGAVVLLSFSTAAGRLFTVCGTTSVPPEALTASTPTRFRRTARHPPSAHCPSHFATLHSSPALVNAGLPSSADPAPPGRTALSTQAGPPGTWRELTVAPCSTLGLLILFILIPTIVAVAPLPSSVQRCACSSLSRSSYRERVIRTSSLTALTANPTVMPRGRPASSRSQPCADMLAPSSAASQNAASAPQVSANEKIAIFRPVTVLSPAVYRRGRTRPRTQ